MTEKKTTKAEKYLSDNGYGKGTNFTVSTVAYLMEGYAAQQSKMPTDIEIFDLIKQNVELSLTGDYKSVYIDGIEKAALAVHKLMLSGFATK